MTLKEVKPGNSVTIRRLNSTGPVKKKLMTYQKHGSVYPQGCSAGRPNRAYRARL